MSTSEPSKVTYLRGARKSPLEPPRARRVAIVGGNRIPFARSDGPYATASNQEMLTAAVDGLAARFALDGRRVGEVVAGAVLKHSRDFNLARETVLGSTLDPAPPPTTSSRPAAPASRPRSPPPTRSRSARSTPAIAGGADTACDAPLGVNDGLRRILLEARRAKSHRQPA